MEQVSAFKANDGALFATLAECQEHEISLHWRSRIDEFQKSGMSPYPTGAQAGLTFRVIVAWEQFKETKAALEAKGTELDARMASADIRGEE